MRTNTILDTAIKSPLSIGDRVSSVFISSEKVYRIIDNLYVDQTKKLFASGLIDKLIKEKLIPAINISSIQLASGDLVLEQDLITPVVYPFEWSPEMLRAAALCNLKINQIANHYGYELKDAHPYNVVFKHGKPQHVDIGSFIKKIENCGWVAEKEFTESYHNILKAVSSGYYGIYKYALVDNTNLRFEISDLCSKIRFVPLANFKYFKNKAIFKYKISSLISSRKIQQIFKISVLVRAAEIILKGPYLPFRDTNYRAHENKLRSYKLHKNTQWGFYHKDSYLHDDGKINLSHRFIFILKIIESLDVNSVVEIGGNQGLLSREICKLKKINTVICSDYDLQAIDNLFLEYSPNEDKLTICCFDLMADVRENLTCERANRLKSDLVVALALTHHLVLTQSYTIGAVVASIAAFTRKFIIIEFMPLGLWDGVSSPPLPEWYSEKTFLAELEKKFDIIQRAHLEQNRIIYLGALKPSEEND